MCNNTHDHGTMDGDHPCWYPRPEYPNDGWNNDRIVNTTCLRLQCESHALCGGYMIKTDATDAYLWGTTISAGSANPSNPHKCWAKPTERGTCECVGGPLVRSTGCSEFLLDLPDQWKGPVCGSPLLPPPVAPPTLPPSPEPPLLPPPFNPPPQGLAAIRDAVQNSADKKVTHEVVQQFVLHHNTDFDPITFTTNLASAAGVKAEKVHVHVKVTTQLTLDQDVASFDLADTKTKLATLYSVDESFLEVITGGGSVVLDVAVTAPGGDLLVQAVLASVTQADAATLTNAIGVDTIIKAAATVRVTATIETPNAAAAEDVISTLQANLSDESAASAALGVSVQSLTAPTAKTVVTPWVQMAPGTIAGIGIGAVAGFCVLANLFVCLIRRRQQQSNRATRISKDIAPPTSPVKIKVEAAGNKGEWVEAS